MDAITDELQAMTLRSAVDVIGIDTDPLGCAFIIAAFLRTAVQRSPSTLEGECASILKFEELTGKSCKEPASIRYWLDDLKAVADIPAPLSWWGELLAAAECDEENDKEADDDHG